MNRERRSDSRLFGARRTRFVSAILARGVARTFLLFSLVAMGVGIFSSDAKAAFVSFTSATIGTLNPPLNITSVVPNDYIAGIYTDSLGGGGDIPDQNPATILSILETQFSLGSGSLTFIGGGACNLPASNCSGFGTTSGSTTNIGNLFGVHIGGQGGGVYVAFLYDHLVSNFSLGWDPNSPAIGGLSNIHTFTTLATPIPAAFLLFGSGLGFLGLASRRRKAA